MATDNEEAVETVDGSLQVDEAIKDRLIEFVKGIKAKQWLQARRYFEEPTNVIASEEVAMTIFIAFLKDSSKGWDYYAEKTMQELGDIIDKAFAEDED